MWEIMTRRIPYDDRPVTFVHQLRKDVLSGIRPTISDDSLPEYVSIMEDCWQTTAALRPTFREVTPRLEALQQSL